MLNIALSGNFNVTNCCFMLALSFATLANQFV